MKGWNQIPGEHRAYLILGAVLLGIALSLVSYMRATDMSDANIMCGVGLVIIAGLGGAPATIIGGVGCLRTVFARKT